MSEVTPPSPNSCFKNLNHIYKVFSIKKGEKNEEKESNSRCLIFRNTLNNLGDAMKSPLARFKKKMTSKLCIWGTSTTSDQTTPPRSSKIKADLDNLKPSHSITWLNRSRSGCLAPVGCIIKNFLLVGSLKRKCRRQLSFEWEHTVS